MQAMVNGMSAHLAKVLSDFGTALPGVVTDKAEAFDASVFAHTGVERATLLSMLLVLLLIILNGLSSIVRALSTRFKSSKGDIILFVGPCNAGKTAMVHKLCYDAIPETVSSMKAGVLKLRLSRGAEIDVVDFPGHKRVRGQLPKYLRRARQIVFVVDASAMPTQLRPAAELLYDIFTDPTMDSSVPMLIACNKADLSTVRTPERVKIMLQQELEKLRKTRQSLGNTDDDEAENKLPLGTEGQAFTFDRDSRCQVTFKATSVTDARLDDLQLFLGCN